MSKKLAKIEKILDIAIELLKNEGDFGVTMRKVATLADMSLSNVQYYFKNKDELLKAMADRYFQQCLIEMNSQPALTKKEELEPLVNAFLVHGHETSDMCRLFREYWAISTRNEAIQAYLEEYYQTLSAVMSEKLQPLAVDEQALSQAVSLFIPYAEGYSVTAKSLPEGLNSMSSVLKNLLWKCLQKEL